VSGVIIPRMLSSAKDALKKELADVPYVAITNGQSVE
jgi:hypothetical protein